MSRLRSRVLLAAGSSSLLLSSLAIADTTAATTEPAPEPGAVETLPPDESSAPPPTSADAATWTWNYVAFGDSWPQGNHCNGCTPFPVLWAEDLDAHPGWDVEFTDFTGEQERSAAQSKGSASLLEALQNDEMTRAAVQTADIILIATGPNELELLGPPPSDTHCPAPEYECIGELGQIWSDNFEAILTEIQTLRDGQPTAIRLVNAANPWLSVPEMNEGLPDDFATTGGAPPPIPDCPTASMCEAAEAHDAICIDVRPLINGSSLDQAGDENAPETMRAITDVLLATGVPELT